MLAAIAIGAVINVIVLLILGGVTVYKFVTPEEVALQAPPPLKAIEPTVVEYRKNQVEERQKKAARPRQKRIETRSVNSIAAPEIQVDMAGFAPGVSVGDGNGDSMSNVGGLSTGGLRMGASAVDFFGIKSNGERVVIILDIAGSMLEQERGDIDGYHRVKERLKEIVESMNSGTLFNVMAYSRGLDVMSPNLVLANAENRERALRFIDPYWKANNGRLVPSAKRSVYLKNYKPNFVEIEPEVGSSRMDMALLASFEQKADAIFLITDGTPYIWRKFTDDERKDYEKRLADWEKRKKRAGKSALEKFEIHKAKEIAAEQKRRDKENAERAKRGLDKRIWEDMVIRIRPPWGFAPASRHFVKGDEFVDWAASAAERVYGKGRNALPELNIVGYSIPKRGKTADFLNSLRRQFPQSEFKVFGEYQGGKGA